MIELLLKKHLKSAHGEIDLKVDGNDIASIELNGKESRIRVKSILSSLEFATQIGFSKGLRLMKFLRDMGFEVKLL